MSMQEKSNSGKSTLAGAVVAAVCIGVYLFALVQAAVRIYLSIDERRITAGMEFVNIADLASAAGVLGFMDEPFIETMNDALASSRTIEALIISGPDGEYAFERHKNQAVTWVNNSPRFINKFEFFPPEPSLPLRIQGLRNVNIQAVAGALDYSVFSRILKETLFLVLSGLTLSFFTMLMYYLLSKPGEKIPSAEIEPEEISAIESSNGPMGLYSPRSNIGWEVYTKDRLESELHRCASTEEDLVVLVIEFVNKIDDIRFRQAAMEAANFFKLKDLLFENGNRGISVIYPGINLETGLEKAQGFQHRAMELFPDGHKRNAVCIGLSSRSGRLLSGERIMFEAMEALHRAKSDRDSSIIAFKSDPDKYRAFIHKKA